MGNSNGKAARTKSQFDLGLERDRESDTIEKPGYVIVPLSPESERRILPKVHRRFAEVDAKLINVFRELITGEIPWPLFLHGPTGVGKTRACPCLCDQAESAVYYSLDHFYHGVLCDQAAWLSAAWQDVKQQSLAVLDEIPGPVMTDHLCYTTVKHFSDLRELYASSVAIFVSNSPPEKLAEIYDDTLMSRLLAGTVFELDGPDRRS